MDGSDTCASSDNVEGRGGREDRARDGGDSGEDAKGAHCDKESVELV